MHSGGRTESASPCSLCHIASSVPERINSALLIRSLGRAVQMPLAAPSNVQEFGFLKSLGHCCNEQITVEV